MNMLSGGKRRANRSFISLLALTLLLSVAAVAQTGWPSHPPSYPVIDSAYFRGGPAFGSMPYRDIGGYYAFYDTLVSRWTLGCVVVPGGALAEQFHGSVIVQLDQEPAPGVNVWPLGFVLSSDLHKNDRWGWVKWPDSIGANLYEIWWDITIDMARLGSTRDRCDTIGISFAGCAYDFNVWATGHFTSLSAAQVKLGKDQVLLSNIPGFSDGIPGLADQYQDTVSAKSPNMTTFTPVDLPGATYNANGLISAGSSYGDAYGGARHYEGNGYQFSTSFCPVKRPPVFNPPLGYIKTFALCQGAAIYDTVTASDPDQNDIVTLRLLSGTGTFSATAGNPARGYYSFIPSASGRYVAVFQAVDKDGNSIIDSATYKVSINSRPSLTVRDTTVFLCGADQKICFPISASDADGDALAYGMISGSGSIDSRTGQICFTAKESGRYDFAVTASDQCSTDTARFTVTIEVNHSPEIAGFDSLVYQCSADSICFNIKATDSDAGDSVAISLTSGPGIFAQTGNGIGRQCFLPGTADSASYVFHYAASDKCWRNDAKIMGAACPPAPSDSVVITVIQNHKPTITCPQDMQAISLCTPDSVCLAIPVTPAGTSVTVLGGGRYTNGKLCFYADKAGRYVDTLIASGACGADTCTVTFDITLGEAPRISCPQPAPVHLCRAQDITIPIPISPSTARVTVSSPVTYQNGMMTFPADTAGNYCFLISATTDCGSTQCRFCVDITIDAPPYVHVPDSTVGLCVSRDICIPVEISDPDGNIDSLIVEPSSAKLSDNQICFTPETAGRYELILTAVDSCGRRTVDTGIVTVQMNKPPQVSLRDTTISLCAQETVCLPVVATDPDGSIASVVVASPGYYDPQTHQACLTVSSSGRYDLIVTARDDCGAEVTDTGVVTILMNVPPELAVRDSALMLCEPATVCLPVYANDLDGTVTAITATPPATYDESIHMVCLSLSEAGRHQVIVTARDNCGATVVDTSYITVNFDLPPQVHAPQDTTVTGCAPEAICLDGFAFADSDNKIATIEFIPSLGTYADGRFCFTPDTAGRYGIIARVTDECGKTAEDTVSVTYVIRNYVRITCPTGTQMINLCRPDTVCLDIPIEPSDAAVSVVGSGGTYKNGKLCFYAAAEGTYAFKIIASGSCNADTCNVHFDVRLGMMPHVICPTTETVLLCKAGTVRVPLTVSPADAEVTIMPDGTYENGVVTFQADTSGTYCFSVKASTSCGIDACGFCVVVKLDAAPSVSVPDSTVNFCTFKEVCLPVSYSDAGGNITGVTVSPAGYQIVDGHICFTPTQAGEYKFIVSVRDSCDNLAIDSGVVTVKLNSPPQVKVSDSTLFLCAPAEVCLPVSYSDPDGSIDSIVVSPPARFDIAARAACLSVAASGKYSVIVTVYDPCGVAVADTADLNVTIDQAPVAQFGDIPATVYQCQLKEICLPVSVSDADDNLTEVIGESSCGGSAVYHSDLKTICWTPTAFGACQLRLIARDQCGKADTVIAAVNVVQSNQSSLTCPADTTVHICTPAVLCFRVSGISGKVSVSPSYVSYDAAHGTVCFTADTNRVDTIYIADSTICGIATCSFVVNTVMNRPPQIKLVAPPEKIVCDTFTLCLSPVVIDPDNNLKAIYVSSDCVDAYYDGATHKICIPIAGTVKCDISVVAVDSCGATDSTSIPISMRGNHAPRIHLPRTTTVARCASDTSTITIADICVDDADYDDVVFVLDSGSGQFTVDPITNCGALRFKPPTNDSAQYRFRFRATDICDTTYDTYSLTIQPVAVCSSCVNVSIDGGSCVNSGATARVNINVKTYSQISGFDLMVAFDASALTFLQANLGDAVDEWEYFTYRFGVTGNCSGTCPSGLVRLIGIADTQNGAHHPPVLQLIPQGVLATITFHVTSDMNMAGNSIPVSFFWYNCGDNAFSDPTGQYLLVDEIVYSSEGTVVWDEANNTHYPESGRLANVGAPDECLQSQKYPPVRCVSLYNGAVCITSPQDIDARGDLNLNGVRYEIADAVIYTNFFISGLSVFNVSVPGQIAASDVNADGLTLSIADLVYLIRVIIGDATPYPKEKADDLSMRAALVQATGRAQVTVQSTQDIGAVLLVFNYDDPETELPTLGAGAKNMEMKAAFVGGTLRVLLYSFQAGGKIEAGRQEVLDIQLPTGARIQLVEADAADYYGRAMTAGITNAALPRTLELSQNRPNPFNPRTIFTMALPVASDYRVTIYNITGQVIRKWAGSAEAGYIDFEWDGTDQNGRSVASGMYFYRAEASGAHAIRKMILLK